MVYVCVHVGDWNHSFSPSLCPPSKSHGAV